MNNRVKVKIIGIIAHFENKPSTQADFIQGGYYLVRDNYIKALKEVIKNKNIIIVMLPYLEKNINNYIELCDGLISVGGHDIPPKLYNENIKYENVRVCEKRFNFEVKIIKKYLKLNKPFLGVCAGMHCLNVANGGSLHQDIEKDVPNSIKHLAYENNKLSPSYHRIKIEKNTKLYEILKKENIKVNSIHHQAIKKLGKNLIESSRSVDNLIESIELKKHKFCIGLQWHIERETTKLEMKVFQEFVRNL